VSGKINTCKEHKVSLRRPGKRRAAAREYGQS
jgi:hypothetical protein